MLFRETQRLRSKRPAQNSRVCDFCLHVGLEQWGSQMGALLSLRVHLEKSRDIFVFHSEVEYAA